MIRAWLQRRRLRRLMMDARALLVEYRIIEMQVGRDIADDVALFQGAYPDARRFAVAFNRLVVAIRVLDPYCEQADLPVAPCQEYGA